MSLPSVQPLLLPTLRMISEGSSVEEVREKLKARFKITQEEAERTHTRSGKNIFVNRVAWALSHLVTGKLIELKEQGVYQVTESGAVMLKGNPSFLEISDLH